MLRKTRRTIAVVALAGALSLGVSVATRAAPSTDAQDRGPRITAVDHHDSLQSWLQAFLSRLLAVWAADGPTETPGGTPTH